MKDHDQYWDLSLIVSRLRLLPTTYIAKQVYIV